MPLPRFLAFLLLLVLATPAFGFSTVVIDAGHGGHDRGGIPGQRVSEKHLTLDMALRVRALLQKRGIRTVMTRSRDVFIPLSERARMGNAYRNAIFVSIHFNSARREGANGIETYFYSRKSSRLAYNIHRQLVRVTPTEDRHVRRRGFYVLRHARNPAVLLECGFLTNGREARLCMSSAYRQRMAEAIVRGILLSR